MEILGMLTVAGEIMGLLVQGVYFVERLFGDKKGQGKTKKEMMMGLAKVAFQSFGSQTDEAKWEKTELHVSQIIDEIVAVMNALK